MLRYLDKVMLSGKYIDINSYRDLTISISVKRILEVDGTYTLL